MSYLGYKYKDQLSTLASRLTLLSNREIKLSFFDEIKLELPDRQVAHLQGFTFYDTSGGLTNEKCEMLIEDLECIHLNKKDTSREEMFYRSSLTKYYQILYRDGMMNIDRVSYQCLL